MTIVKANPGLAAAALQSAPQEGRAPEGFVPLTPEALLLFCNSRLRDLDTAIRSKMQKQTDKVHLQNAVSEVQSMITAGDGNVNADAGIAYENTELSKSINGKIDEAIKAAYAQGDTSMATSLESVRNIFNAGGPHDVKVSKEEVKTMSQTLESALSASHSGAEISMIELQSLVSQRATALQLTTGMMNSVNEGAKAIVGNVGR